MLDGCHLLATLGPVRITEVAEMEATLFEPPWEGAKPRLVLVTGALVEGRSYPPLVKAATAFALAGSAVLVPELGRLRELILSDAAVDDLVAAVLLQSRRPEKAAGPVGLYGFSLGGGLALIAAAREEIRTRVAFVASLGGYFDVLDVARQALTGAAARTTVYTAAASLIAMLMAPADRRLLERALATAPEPHPLAGFEAVDRRPLSREGKAVLDLLRCRDPDRLPALTDRLPQRLRSGLARLSPSSIIGSVTAPVWLVHDERDPYIQPEQSAKIAAALRDRGEVRFRSTRILDHTEPALTGSGWRARLELMRAAPELVGLTRLLAATIRANKGRGGS